MLKNKELLFVKVRKENQEHVLKYWDDLNERQKKMLLKDIDSIDFVLLRELISGVMQKDTGKNVFNKLEPAEITGVPTTDEEICEYERASEAGEESIRRGEVCSLVVAGGQGTRLKFSGPKGLYPITPVKGKSFLELNSEKILAINLKYGINMKFLIMTSPSNRLQITRFMKRNDYFGLKYEDVLIFQQDEMPAIDQNGLLILEKPYKIFKNPNGHGGVFKALKKSGISNKLKAVGIKHIFYFQIDNPLVKVADPAFIGYHIIRKAEISTKIVAKVNPEEKVGVVARMDGRLGIVEYSDLSQELMRQRDNQGLLLFRGGNIAVHCIEVDFAEKITEEGNNLPFHKAQKKIKIFDREAQGIKFETFIFDALGYAENSVTMEVKREEEFAPVKNFSGTDSPESARSMMSEYCCRWLEQAGISIPRTRDGYSLVKVEISPLYACDLNDFLHKFRGCFELNPGVEIYLSRSLDSLKADA